MTQPYPPPLVAVAHGSRDPRAAATVEELLDRVRRASGPRVVSSFLDHSPPTPAQALGGLAEEGDGRAVVLPLLLTAAYHSKIDIPRALADARRAHPRLDLRYGATLGPHPLLTTALQRRLAEAGVPDDPDVAVVLAVAGSSDPAANRAIRGIARRWPDRRTVVAAYASGPGPRPAEAVRALRDSGVTRVAVASYFLAPGLFADRVYEDSMNAGAMAVSPVLGAAPEIAEIILYRYHTALIRGEESAAS